MTFRRYKRNLVVLRWLVLLAAVVLTSCSQTRFVPHEEYLLQKVELEIDDPDINNEEAKAFVRQKENYKILGFMRFYLFLYNLSSKKKSDDWLKRIGEAPQLYDEVLAERSVEQLRQFMDNKGFYRAQISKSVSFNDKKQKASIKFNVKTGDQYTIQKVNYHFVNPELRDLFMNDSMSLRFRTGTPFDVYELEKKQNRIVKTYRDNGYYYFSKYQIRYLADTSLYEKQVKLDVFIGETTGTAEDSALIFKKYYLNDFYYSVLPGNTAVTATGKDDDIFSDTIEWDNSHLYLNKQIKYPSALFERTNQMESGSLYRASEVENTFNALNRLRQFRFVDIQFAETAVKNDSNLLDCNIRLAPLNKQSTSFDIEGTNTSGNFGVAGNIYYQHRNLFKGAEVLQVRLKGAMERLHRKNGEGTEYFNTRELGAETSLTVPKLLGPGSYIRSFEKYLPKTVFNIGYNYQRRPEYTRTISNLKFGYDWKTSQNVSHLWNILDLNIVHLSAFDDGFINSIKDLYIKSSFTDHFIFSTNYSRIFNSQRLNSKVNYSYMRFNVESGGNVLWALSEITGQNKHSVTDETTGRTEEFYKFLNTRYAQYLKSDIEFRRAIRIDKYNAIVGRAFIGVGFPFGNTQLLPFEKQYFSGGANGIRAWQVRSLGPGTYKAKEDAYPNQSSDIKIEFNLEYRYHLLGSLEGAFFIDAGNIWAINSDDNREGAQFKFDKFYREFAVGTGTGFRFDLSYFIMRVDLGLKLRDPSSVLGERWIIGNRKIKSDDFNLTFAIGYPF